MKTIHHSATQRLGVAATSTAQRWIALSAVVCAAFPGCSSGSGEQQETVSTAAGGSNVGGAPSPSGGTLASVGGDGQLVGGGGQDIGSGGQDVGTGGTAGAGGCVGEAQNAYLGSPGSVPGTIEAEDFDPGGSFDSTSGNEGGAYRTDVDADIKELGSGYAIGWMTSGEWLEYTVNVAVDGDYDVTLRAGAVDAGRTLGLSLCGTALTGPIAVPQIAAWGDMATTTTGPVHLSAGLQVIRVTVGASDDVDFDSMTFEEVAIGTGGAGGTGGTDGSGGDPGTGGEPGTGGDPGTGGSDVVPSPGCGTTTSFSGESTNTINVNGSNREYILRLPDDYASSHPYRLMVAIHCLNGTAAGVASGSPGADYEYYGLWARAGGSTIFVAPQGINNSWPNSGGGDAAFIMALVEYLESELCIDTSRIFAEGFSMGGSMSYALACAFPETFRAIAVHSGGPMSGCDQSNRGPVAYFMTHGINDSVCTYPGYGVPQLEDFAERNGCDPMSLPTPTDGSGNTPACVDYQDCDPACPTRACLFVGDHTPSPPNESSTWVPDETWDFILQF